MKIRSFIAINFPVATTRRIAEEIGKLSEEARTVGHDIAWVPAANLHLTMKFLGMIEEESVAAIVSRLQRELVARTPFELEARGIGVFPEGATPRVLWAGVKASQALGLLQQDLERWLAETGFPREPRAFHPHVTIGRVKTVGTTPLAPLVQSRSELVLGSGRATELVVYESRTRRSGSEYIALGRVAIGNAS